MEQSSPSSLLSGGALPSPMVRLAPAWRSEGRNPIILVGTHTRAGMNRLPPRDPCSALERAMKEREPLVLASQPASQPANCSRPAPDSHVIPLTQFQHPCHLPELTLGAALPFPYQARSWLLSSPLKPFVSCTSSLLLNLSSSSTPPIIKRGITPSTRRTSHQPLQSTPHFAHHVPPLYVLPRSSAPNGDDIVCFLSCL